MLGTRDHPHRALSESLNPCRQTLSQSELTSSFKHYTLILVLIVVAVKIFSLWLNNQAERPGPNQLTKRWEEHVIMYLLRSICLGRI